MVMSSARSGGRWHGSPGRDKSGSPVNPKFWDPGSKSNLMEHVSPEGFPLEAVVS